jgi:hypothetical protein
VVPKLAIIYVEHPIKAGFAWLYRITNCHKTRASDLRDGISGGQSIGVGHSADAAKKAVE